MMLFQMFPQSSKHLISTGSSSTANISKHIVILQCTARASLQGAHEDLGKCCKFQIYEMCSSSSGDSLLCYGHGPTHHKMSTKLHTRMKKNHTYQNKKDDTMIVAESKVSTYRLVPRLRHDSNQ